MAGECESRVICPDYGCREELIQMIHLSNGSHVTHKGMLAYIGVPIGVIGIIIGLVMTIVSSNFGGLQQNLMVSKQRNDYQDQRLVAVELADAAMKGDLGIIKEKMANMDKSLGTIADAVLRIENRK